MANTTLCKNLAQLDETSLIVRIHMNSAEFPLLFESNAKKIEEVDLNRNDNFREENERQGSLAGELRCRDQRLRRSLSFDSISFLLSPSSFFCPRVWINRIHNGYREVSQSYQNPGDARTICRS